MSELTSGTQDVGGGAGQLIRQARESQGVAIDTLAAIIKVPVAKLQALEADDRTVLPDANFNRALAMTVCRALKVDPAPILSQMPAAVAVALAASKPPLNQPFKDFSHTGLTFESTSPIKLSVPKLSPAMLAPVVLFVLAALIYLLPEDIDWKVWRLTGGAHKAEQADKVDAAVNVASQADVVASLPDVASSVAAVASEQDEASVPAASQPFASSVMATTTVSAAASAVSTMASAPAKAVAVVQAASGLLKAVSATSAAQVVAVASVPASSAVLKVPAKAMEATAAASVAKAPVVTAPAAASAPAVAASGPTGKITLVAKEPAWVEVRDGTGQRLFSRQLAAGERVDVQGVAPLKVHAGNAPSLSLQFNGRPVDLVAVTKQNVARIELK